MCKYFYGIWQAVLQSLMWIHLRTLFCYLRLSNMFAIYYEKYMCHTYFVGIIKLQHEPVRLLKLNHILLILVMIWVNFQIISLGLSIIHLKLVLYFDRQQSQSSAHIFRLSRRQLKVRCLISHQNFSDQLHD